MGSWHPARVALARRPDGIWEKRLYFPPDTELQFKFTLGDWSREALAADSTLPGNHVLTLRNDTTVIYQIDAWRDEHFRQRVHGQITGTVRYHRQLAGEGLKPRDVIVWLPPDYESALQRRYPVLYMHDGQNIIDPQTSAFGQDWRVDEVADSLIRTGEIEPLIVVGIYN
ncbi:MAG: histidine kinase, partial [Calditrichaeota bacterium]|nr:histidine kinase [Calditrichota bacterium]